MNSDDQRSARGAPDGKRAGESSAPPLPPPLNYASAPIQSRHRIRRRRSLGGLLFFIVAAGHYGLTLAAGVLSALSNQPGDSPIPRYLLRACTMPLGLLLRDETRSGDLPIRNPRAFLIINSLVFTVLVLGTWRAMKEWKRARRRVRRRHWH